MNSLQIQRIKFVKIFNYLLFKNDVSMLLKWYLHFSLYRPLLGHQCVPYFCFAPSYSLNTDHETGMGKQYLSAKHLMEK